MRNHPFYLFLTIAYGVLTVIAISRLDGWIDLIYLLRDFDVDPMDLIADANHVFWISLVSGIIKPLIFLSLSRPLIRREVEVSHREAWISFAVLVILVYLDLPIHRCYSGALESYWEANSLGHFH